MPTQSPTQQRLQKTIYQKASNFLHLHMLPLKALPKVLKHATPHGRLPSGTPNGSISSSPTISSVNGRPQPSALASIKYGTNAAAGSNTSIASDNSSAISALEAE
jgi:hypothetical protein